MLKFEKKIRRQKAKHAAHSPFFSLQDAVYFIMLSFLVPVIFTFLNTGCAKILKKIPAPKC